MWGSKAAASRDRKAKLQAEWAVYREAKAELARQYGEGTRSFAVQPASGPTMLMLTDDAIRWAVLAEGTGFQVIDSGQMLLSDVTEASISQGTHLENYRKRVVTPVAVAKPKSAIGRGLVGAMVAGPAGLILGAASAIAPETRVEGRVTHENGVRVATSSPSFVISTPEETLHGQVNLASTAEELADAMRQRGLKVQLQLAP